MKDYTELIKMLPAPVATELYYLNHAIETDNWTWTDGGSPG